MSCQPTWAERIRHAVAGELDASAWPALRAHLRTCAACRAAYDRAGDAVAVLEGRPGGAPEAVRGASRAALFAALDAQAVPPIDVEGPSDPLAPSAPRARSGRGLWAGLGLLAVAAAAVMLWPANPQIDLEKPGVGFTARGGQLPQVGFKLFCLDVAGDAPRIRSVAAPLGPPARCAASDRLQFTWSSTLDGPQPLQIFAVGPEGVVWFWPPADASGLEGPATDRPLPGSFSAPGAAAGHYRVYAVAGATLAEDEVEAWWAAGEGRPEALPGQVMHAELEVQ